MKTRRKLHAFTDYPFYEGDKSVKQVHVIVYDGDKYCRVHHSYHGDQEVKSGYLFKNEALTKYLSKRSLYYITSRNSWDYFDNKNTSVIPKLEAERMLKEDRKKCVKYIVYEVTLEGGLKVVRSMNNFVKARDYAVSISKVKLECVYHVFTNLVYRHYLASSGGVFSAINGHSFNYKGAKHG